MDELLTFPTTPDSVSPQNVEEFAYLDIADVYRNYDSAIVQMLRIPVPEPKLKRPILEDELNEIGIVKLRKLAAQLGVNSETDRKDLLIKAIVNSQIIPVVFATPDITYASQEVVTGRKENTPSYTVRYPIISVNRLYIAKDQKRFFRPVHRKIAWTKDGNAVSQAYKPSPVIFTYQIEFLSLFQKHSNYMDMYWERIFTFPRIRLKVDHGKPWGNIWVSAEKTDSYNDSSVYESDSTEAEKLIRHIYTVSVEGWLPTATWLTPTVRRVQYDYVGQRPEGDELLLSTEVELENTYDNDEET